MAKYYTTGTGWNSGYIQMASLPLDLRFLVDNGNTLDKEITGNADSNPDYYSLPALYDGAGPVFVQSDGTTTKRGWYYLDWKNQSQWKEDKTGTVVPNAKWVGIYDKPQVDALFDAMKLELGVVYKAKGSATVADLNALTIKSDYYGYVYNMSDSGTLTANKCLNGNAIKVVVGDQILINGDGKFDILHGIDKDLFQPKMVVDTTLQTYYKTGTEKNVENFLKQLYESKQDNLPSGNNGQFLTLASNKPSWVDFPTANSSTLGGVKVKGVKSTVEADAVKYKDIVIDTNGVISSQKQSYRIEGNSTSIYPNELVLRGGTDINLYYGNKADQATAQYKDSVITINSSLKDYNGTASTHGLVPPPNSADNTDALKKNKFLNEKGEWAEVDSVPKLTANKIVTGGGDTGITTSQSHTVITDSATKPHANYLSDSNEEISATDLNDYTGYLFFTNKDGGIDNGEFLTWGDIYTRYRSSGMPRLYAPYFGTVYNGNNRGSDNSSGNWVTMRNLSHLVVKFSSRTNRNCHPPLLMPSNGDIWEVGENYTSPSSSVTYAKGDYIKYNSSSKSWSKITASNATTTDKSNSKGTVNLKEVPRIEPLSNGDIWCTMSAGVYGPGGTDVKYVVENNTESWVALRDLDHKRTYAIVNDAIGAWHETINTFETLSQTYTDDLAAKGYRNVKNTSLNREVYNYSLRTWYGLPTLPSVTTSIGGLNHNANSQYFSYYDWDATSKYDADPNAKYSDDTANNTAYVRHKVFQYGGMNPYDLTTNSNNEATINKYWCPLTSGFLMQMPMNDNDINNYKPEVEHELTITFGNDQSKLQSVKSLLSSNGISYKTSGYVVVATTYRKADEVESILSSVDGVTVTLTSRSWCHDHNNKALVEKYSKNTILQDKHGMFTSVGGNIGVYGGEYGFRGTINRDRYQTLFVTSKLVSTFTLTIGNVTGIVKLKGLVRSEVINESNAFGNLWFLYPKNPECTVEWYDTQMSENVDIVVRLYPSPWWSTNSKEFQYSNCVMEVCAKLGRDYPHSSMSELVTGTVSLNEYTGFITSYKELPVEITNFGVVGTNSENWYNNKHYNDNLNLTPEDIGESWYDNLFLKERGIKIFPVSILNDEDAWTASNYKKTTYASKRTSSSFTVNNSSNSTEYGGDGKTKTELSRTYEYWMPTSFSASKLFYMGTYTGYMYEHVKTVSRPYTMNDKNQWVAGTATTTERFIKHNITNGKFGGSTDFPTLSSMETDISNLPQSQKVVKTDFESINFPRYGIQIWVTPTDGKFAVDDTTGLKVGNTVVSADSKDGLTLVADTGITLTPDANNKKITIANSSPNTDYTKISTKVGNTTTAISKDSSTGVTLVEGTGVTLKPNASNGTIEISSSSNTDNTGIMDQNGQLVTASSDAGVQFVGGGGTTVKKNSSGNIEVSSTAYSGDNIDVSINENGVISLHSHQVVRSKTTVVTSEHSNVLTVYNVYCSLYNKEMTVANVQDIGHKSSSYKSPTIIWEKTDNTKVQYIPIVYISSTSLEGALEIVFEDSNKTQISCHMLYCMDTPGDTTSTYVTNIPFEIESYVKTDNMVAYIVIPKDWTGKITAKTKRIKVNQGSYAAAQGIDKSDGNQKGVNWNTSSSTVYNFTPLDKRGNELDDKLKPIETLGSDLRKASGKYPVDLVIDYPIFQVGDTLSDITINDMLFHYFQYEMNIRLYGLEERIKALENSINR